MRARLGFQGQKQFLLIDRAYHLVDLANQGNEISQLPLAKGFTPVVPPGSTRVGTWE